MTFASALQTLAIALGALLGLQPADPAAPLADMTVTATTAPAASAEALAALDRLEQAGRQYPALASQVEYTVEDLAFADRETRTGKVFYQQAPQPAGPDRFRISFDTVQAGLQGPRVREEVDYVFDGYWLTSRKPRIKQMVRYQVARPGEPATDALKLGKGPFPVPFGQQKDEVLRQFTVTTRPARPGDPANADYLRLVPRQRPEEGGLAVKELEMWIDVRGLPVRIRSVDDQNAKITVVRFAEIDTAPRLTDETFALPRPPSDWEFRIEPLRDGAQIAP